MVESEVFGSGIPEAGGCLFFVPLSIALGMTGCVGRGGWF